MRISKPFSEWRHLTPQSCGETLLAVMGKASNESAVKMISLPGPALVIHFNKKTSATDQDYGKFALADCSIGMAGVVCNTPSLHRNMPVKELHRIMNVGGGICFFITKRGRLHTFRQFLELHGFDFVQDYAVLPSFRNPHWVIPVSARFLISSAEGMLRPSKPFKWLLWKWGVRLSHLGLFPLIVRDRLVVAKKKGEASGMPAEGLRSLVERLLNKEALEISLLRRPRKYYGKTTAQVMDKKGRIFAYAKIATRPQAKRLLEDEANTLEKLEQLKLQTAHIPRLIYFGQIEQDTILVQAVEYPLKPGPLHLSNQHISFLGEIFHKTSQRWRFEESPLRLSLQRDIQGLATSNADGWGELLQITLERLRQRFSQQEIPLGLAHQDFVPWNTCRNKEKQLVVFDWELASDNAVPLTDFYNFVIHADSLLRNKKGSEILTRLLNEKGRYFELLTQYKTTLKGEPFFDHVGFLMIYLYQTSISMLKYRNLQTQAGFNIEQSVEQLLTIQWSILEELLRLGQETYQASTNYRL